MKDEYFNTAETRQLLEHSQLSQFEQIWALDTDWFEPPNYRRNGWSGVIKYPLTDSNGKTTWVFIKRQENHNFKTLWHPFKGIPTFRREYNNIRHLTNKQVPTLTTLYYGERSRDGKDQAILITQSLEGYQSFEEFFADNTKEIPQRSEIMKLAGQIIRKMHDAHFRHNCLYAKHLFVSCNADNTDTIEIRLIDLEKLKWLPLLKQIRRNDLSRLIRRGEPLIYNDLKKILYSYYRSGQDLHNSTLASELNTLLEHQERYQTP
ncbi:MAG: lipopolysaccharide kinase InaA family protein [gamma proteobacterium symbiont of Taylorina sp.]|nr:lipopolysaccharide kinase InaA family protein [gamma proteobacterium symbiont of Taylorina sp.]